MSAQPSSRPVSRLEKAREELKAAKAAHVSAFSADGFDPKRADRAEARLEAAQAVFEDEVEWDRGQGERRSREEKIAKIDRKLQGAERALRATTFNLRRAVVAAHITFYQGISTEIIQERINAARELVDGLLAAKGISPKRRQEYESTKGLLAEAEYRLDSVIQLSQEVERIRGDIALLKQVAAK